MRAKHPVSLPWSILFAGSFVGVVASFIQTIERIQFAEQPQRLLSCDLNSVFSCSSVFDSWQSSVFGFSNSIMCLLFFGVMLGVALAGLGGGQLGKKMRFIMHFASLFFLGFGAWYLQQSTFAIRALCIFCIFCYAGVIAINWAWLRLNVVDLPLTTRHKDALQRGIKNGADTFIWLLWAIMIAAMFVFSFW